MTQPLVSVLMTSYNREKYIAEAIESVLKSTYQHFELIIVDDHSKDGTVAIAKSYAAKDARVKVYVNEQNLGDYHNRNKAASYATGKYIKYLDADDMFYYYGLEVMVAAMEAFPEAGFGLASLPEDERPFPVCIEPATIYKEHFINGVGHFSKSPGSAIMNRECFNKVGGFYGARLVGDCEMWCKMGRYFKMVKFPVDLYWNRIHEQQESASKAAKSAKPLYDKVFEDALAHPDCPLSAEEVKAIRSKIKKDEAMSRTRQTLSRLSKLIRLKNR